MLGSALLPPPLPPWDGIHPLIVHFPIALLLVSPLFVLLGFLPKVGRGFALAGLVLMVLGTIGAYVAVESGEAGAELVTRTPEVAPVLQQHRELADTVRVLFTVLTAVWAVLLFGPALLKNKKLPAAAPTPASASPPKIRNASSNASTPSTAPAAAPTVAKIAFLVAYLLCAIVLANVGHLGGRLVHQYGVQAWFDGK